MTIYYKMLCIILLTSSLLNCADSKKSLPIDFSGIARSDLLQYYSKKPEHLDFVENNQGQGQILCSSLYKVPGKYASVIEKYFIDNCAMSNLVFVCCGWENENGFSGEFRTIEYIEKTETYLYYSVSMYSDESIINDREKWNEIPYFYVLAEISEL